MKSALLLSGGIGSRIDSDIPKQYMEVEGRSVISYCIETLSKHDEIDKIQIVAAPEWHGIIHKYLEEYDINRKFCGFSLPGQTRQLSIYNGLSDMSRYMTASDVVLIHDAARPFLSAKIVTDCLDAMRGHDGVMPALPVKDTVYRSMDGRIVHELINRDEIFAGQAPECFVFGKYLEVNRRLLPDRILEINGSTEPAVLAGMDIVMIPGDENNFKITTQADLDKLRIYLKHGGIKTT